MELATRIVVVPINETRKVVTVKRAFVAAVNLLGIVSLLFCIYFSRPQKKRKISTIPLFRQQHSIGILFLYLENLVTLVIFK